MEIVVSQWRAADVIVADILDIFCGERGEGESCVQVIFRVQENCAGSMTIKIGSAECRRQTTRLPHPPP